MRVWSLLLFIGVHFSAMAQLSDSCVGSHLKEIDVYVEINGHFHEDSIFLKPDALNNKIELKVRNSDISIIGFRILSDCLGCDIVEYPICGNKVPDKYVKILGNFFGRKRGWLQFYDITVTINGRKYFAKQFTAFPAD